MTFEEAQRAAELSTAYSGLAEVTEGLAKTHPSQRMWLNIVALDGDEDGGCHEGATMIPAGLWPQIIDCLKDILGDELARLGVDVPLDPEATEE